MDFGSLPCACGLAVRPRRPFGMTNSTAEAPGSGTGLKAPGAAGLSAVTAATTLRRCRCFLIQGAVRSTASRRVGPARFLRSSLRELLYLRIVAADQGFFLIA